MNKRHYSPARIRSASYNDEAGTIDIVWSTGADVLRQDWDGGGEYIERLLMGEKNVRLGRLNSGGAPLLDSHRSDGVSNVIGVVVEGSAKIKDGVGIATVRLSSAAGDSDSVQKIREGVIKNISVGYWIHNYTRQKGENNGPDIWVCDDWEPLEVSAVPIPADANAQFRSADGRRTKRRSRAEKAAAYVRSLIKPAISREQARGAEEARKLLRLVGRA